MHKFEKYLTDKDNCVIETRLCFNKNTTTNYFTIFYQAAKHLIR